MSSTCPDEELLLAFAEGRQEAESQLVTARHVDGCRACQQFVMAAVPVALSRTDISGAPVPRELPVLAHNHTVGRYVVLALVGSGGMGEVYAAYDPELDRKIALKILHAGAGPDVEVRRAHMLREAQAIARLSHPNVVVVHDAGTVGERVYIAMEFVDGPTVAEWMRECPRDWREVRDVFLAAGRGLAAAHAAGIVHRDFKPHNVMVGRDGKVRVMDFGLAFSSRVETGGDLAFTPPVASQAEWTTGTGSVVGTPAYMAPEQFSAEPVDASTDQFSFCVSLFEGLYGERPFAGAGAAELGAAVKAGKVREPAQPGRVPAWLRRIVLRGLQTRREDRHPSMDVLLEALADDPAARTRRRALWAAFALAVVGGSAGAVRLGSSGRQLCQGGAGHFAGVWETGAPETGRRAAIHRAFDASGRADAERAFSGFALLLDDYVARWTSMYAAACEATNVRGEQSAEVLDLRMSCLDERLGNVRALSDAFAAGGSQAVENAVNAAAALPPLDRCADVPLLRAVIKPPEDPAMRRRVDDLRGELARFIAARDAGHCKQALETAEPLIEKVRATGYQPLLAETLLAAAAAGDACSDASLSIDRYKAAHTAACASRHDEVAAESSTGVVFYAVNRLQDLSLARVWLDVARGDVARLQREGFANASLASDEGEIALSEGHFDRALEQADHAIAVLRRLYGPDHPWTINHEMNKADWLERAGRLEESLAATKDVAAHYERVLGPDDPHVGMEYLNLGEVLALLHRFDEAAHAYERSLANLRQSGVDETIIAWTLSGLGGVRVQQGQAAAAQGLLEQALTIRERRKASPAQLGETRFNLARALWSRPPARDRALALATAARADLNADAKAAAEVDDWLARARR